MPISPGQLLNRLRSFRVEQSVKRAIDQNGEKVAGYNRSQLEKGEGTDGKKLNPYKRAAYARRKNRMNPLPGYGNPDLKLTGRLHSEITVKTTASGYSMESTAPYARYLEKRDGSRIYGVGDVNKPDMLKTILRPAILEDLSKHTGLSIRRH